MSSSTDELIPVGYVRRAHGVRGDVLIRPQTDDPDRFDVGRILVTDEDPVRELQVRSRRSQGSDLVVAFEGVADRTEAETLRGAVLRAPAGERRRLDPDEYWPEDLIGCTVVDVAGDVVGTVSDVVVGESQDRLVVSDGSTTLGEVPFVKALVPTVDLSGRSITVDLPHGLLAPG